MAASTPMPVCPVAGMCKRMLERPGSSLVLSIPGLVLVSLGVLILIEPRILLWLVAAALIVMGAALVGLAWFVRRTRA